MIKIEQQFKLQASQQQVWDFFMDVDRVAGVMPGVQSVKELGPDRYDVVLSVKIGPIKPKFKGEVAFIDKNEPESMRIRIDWQDALTKSKARSTAQVHLTPLEAGQVEVRVSADVDVMGALGKYGQGVADKKAGEITQEFAAGMQRSIETSS
jgi:hypothetical protein